jgi:hypothetical protein
MSFIDAASKPLSMKTRRDDLAAFGRVLSRCRTTATHAVQRIALALARVRTCVGE